MIAIGLMLLFPLRLNGQAMTDQDFERSIKKFIFCMWLLIGIAILLIFTGCSNDDNLLDSDSMSQYSEVCIDGILYIENQDLGDFELKVDLEGNPQECE